MVTSDEQPARKRMRWMYRLQQRVAITRNESNVIIGLAFLFFVGLAVRYVQNRPEPLPQEAYVEDARRFEEASAAPAAEAGEEAAPASGAASAATPPPRPVLPAAPINLNTATAAQLQRLPRIGPKMAERIIAHRDEHGPFRRVQDLVHVRGIGEKTLAQLAPLLFVEEKQ